MVNKSTNINQTRKVKQWWSTIQSISTKQESLSSDGQQFNQYQPNKKVFTVMVNNSININQTRKFKQWWSTIQSISTKQERL